MKRLNEEMNLTLSQPRARVYIYIYINVCVQDPPNAALECEVDGVPTATAITISAPVLMTDETGAMTLTYNAEFVSMTRGGPNPLNSTASAEDVVEEELICDDDSSVSLFIDSYVPASSCPSPMSPLPSSQTAGICLSSANGQCADGYPAQIVCVDLN